MKTEMKVLLYLKRNEQSEKDMCPLMGRISIKGRYNSTAQFSCKMKVDSKIWNAESGFQNLECHFSTLYG